MSKSVLVVVQSNIPKSGHLGIVEDRSGDIVIVIEQIAQSVEEFHEGGKEECFSCRCRGNNRVAIGDSFCDCLYIIPEDGDDEVDAGLKGGRSHDCEMMKR